jgi:cytidyltransferase-like protein
MTRTPVGAIHGRFQPLHLGHMEYLLAGKSRCEFLYIGITNPDPSVTFEHPADKARGRAENNPYTYWERAGMLRDALLEAKVPRGEFEIVPFPIVRLDLLRQYVPENATLFLTIYDDWGRSKADMLRAMNFQVDVMWELAPEKKGITATEVREQIQLDGNWRELVPPAARPWIERAGWPG